MQDANNFVKYSYMKQHLENSLKMGLTTGIFFIPLLVIAPLLDHFFTSIEDDVEKKERKSQIVVEVLLHLVVLVMLWYMIYQILHHTLKKYLRIKMDEHIKDGYGIVGAVVLVGLQKNLIEKLNYLTVSHPIRG